MNYSIDKLHVYTLNVGFARHDGDWNWKNVRSPFARLYLVVEGRAQISLPSGIYNLTPGHLYYIPAFTTHSYICDSLFSHYYIHIYENNLEAESMLNNWDFPVEADATEYDIELLKRLTYINPFLKLPMSNPEIYDNHKTLVSNIDMNVRRPFHVKMESRGILFILLSRFLKMATPKVETRDDRIRTIISHIRSNLYENQDIDHLAKLACMSKDHFIRIFRKETGETPNAYITKRKMEAAELLLITSEDSIKSVAMSLCYDDCSYFNQTFKKYSGITPQQYRMAHKNGITPKTIL